MSNKVKLIISFVVLFLLISCVVFQISEAMVKSRNFTNSPEQFEHVEVVRKRIIKRRSGGYKITPETYYTYIVAFKFFDGSIKEFKVSFSSQSPEDGGGKIYCSIYEGEKGIITYKEIKNIEKKYKKEENHWEGRQFINFEKDF